jgi:hypothetical protein
MRGHTDAALKKVTFTATVEGLDHSGGTVVGHGTIVCHQDDEGVFLDAHDHPVRG